MPDNMDHSDHRLEAWRRIVALLATATADAARETIACASDALEAAYRNGDREKVPALRDTKETVREITMLADQLRSATDEM